MYTLKCILPSKRQGMLTQKYYSIPTDLVLSYNNKQGVDMDSHWFYDLLYIMETFIDMVFRLGLLYYISEYIEIRKIKQ